MKGFAFWNKNIELLEFLPGDTAGFKKKKKCVKGRERKNLKRPVQEGESEGHSDDHYHDADLDTKRCDDRA